MTMMNNSRRHVSRRTCLLVLLGGATLLPGVAAASDWYVDGLNGHQRNPGSAASPFQYVWQGVQAARPGDRVHVLPTIAYPNMALSQSGTSTHPITYTGAVGASGVLTRAVGDPGDFPIWINADYVIVEDFDISAPGTRSGVQIAPHHHHVTIANNVIHDSGGDGISTFSDDYLTISHNIVYGNAKNTSNHVFGSGISTLANIDIDKNTGFKNFIDGNIVYGNTNQPSCQVASCLATAQDSDGNGIIIDDLRRTQTDNIPYRGRTLITNNVVFGNGGRGIHIYKSDHVTATGNTVFSNNQDPYEGNYRPGEIGVQTASDVAIYDNILFSDGGTGVGNGRNTGTHLPLSISDADANGGTGQVVAAYNLGFSATGNQQFVFTRGNTVPVTVSSTLWGDPLFVRSSLNPAIADFHLRVGSPALGAANAATSAAYDLLGKSRAAAPSLGALQSPGH